MKYDPFIYGKDQTEGITSIEIEEGKTTGSFAKIYKGKEFDVSMDNEYYILYDNDYTGNMVRLAGDLHYCWAQKFQSKKDYQAAIGISKAKGWDYYTVYNPKESFMIKNGVTYYKGLDPKDVSVLSFDIETTGLKPENSKLLMISNTYRDEKGVVSRRLFCYDEYKSEKEMIYAWCSYVNDCDPSIMLGHNILGFDLPYLKFKSGTLPIGKLQENAKHATKPSLFRKDGSQSYDYYNVLVPGREVIDTFHLALKYDTARNYPSYGLKPIIEYEKLEDPNRVHWDFEKYPPSEMHMDHKHWENFKSYCEHDADDSLKLFDLMIPAYFYYCQSIPKTLQQIVNSATGSQVNSFMVRSYLSEKHSLPKASEVNHYEGGISFGNPGIYKNVHKVDVASLYPSIIIRDSIYDSNKDPKGNFLKMVKHFTAERLHNKKKYSKTGDRKYKDLSDAQKIVINSAYGFMGARGLLFNSPHNAAVVTREGREILQKGIDWAEALDYTIVNADTDSFSYHHREIDYEENHLELRVKYLNEIFPEEIVWEDDGYYEKFVVVKAKNYVMKDARTGEVTIKGSALKASMKEPELKEFNKDVIKAILEDREYELRDIYKAYARACCTVNMDTIAGWSSKKTITKSVLNPKRTNEQRIKDAIQAAGKQVQEGDKIHVYFKTDTELALPETFDGTYSKKKLLGKLFKTAKVFEPILSMDQFPNYALKKNAKELKEIEKGPQETGDLPLKSPA